LKKSSISKKEYELLEKLRKANMQITDISTLEKISDFKKTQLYRMIFSLKSKGIVIKTKRGQYVFQPMGKTTEILPIACKIFWPSYISFWTALSFYKFTEQLPTEILLVSTKKGRQINFYGTKIRFIKLSQNRFFGYVKINETVIAEKEKALVDSLLLPRYAGGISEISKCLRNSWKEINPKTLIDYALKMNNKSVLKRLGYLMETEKLKCDKKLVEKINKKIGRGYSKLDPQLPKTKNYDKKWALIINAETGKLIEGVV